eukprot:CAMPEP_0194175826 /NCGR_PEP_ID=MMETSP0154-20130528/9829_1 /TAXON_ID=1049557 /ORGANISM="Thalassiothrix antarctica, Strain L6-D1" /LENGTH=614 /DNA_ID=CAMNT_0038889795 /DNA_START=91 /DNA_END=1935 /DNA_ORIENTATION=+
MSSPEDALPANFMGATLKGGQLKDLRAYLRAVEPKQKELKESITNLQKDDSNDLEIKLKECEDLITGLKKIIRDKTKSELQNEFDPTKVRCGIAPPESRQLVRNNPGETLPLPDDFDDNFDEIMPPPEGTYEDMEEKMIEQQTNMIMGASQRNDFNEIIHLVENWNANPSIGNKMKQTPLHIAALWGNVESVKQLLQYDVVNVNAQNDFNGATALHSIYQGRGKSIPRLQECQELLLKHGADPKILDLQGKTAAEYWNGDTKTRCLVNQLIGGNNDQPALFQAIEKGSLLSVKRILNPTANSSNKRVKIFNLQSAIGQKLNGKIGTVITEEVDKDSGRHQVRVDGIKQIKLLKPMNLEPQVEKKEDDKKQQSSLFEQRYLGQSPILYNANQILEERENMSTPDNMVALVGILQYLSKEGREHYSDGNFDNNFDNINIHSFSTMLLEDEATEGNDEKKEKNPFILIRVCDEVQLLYDDFEREYDADQKEEINMEIRIMEEVCRLLIPFYMGTEKKKIVTKFHSACRKNHLPLVRFYLEVMQIEPNTPGQGGMTALHLAARSGCTRAVHFLLDKNADTAATNNTGKTPFDLAKINKKQDIMTLLEEHLLKSIDNKI